MEIVDCYKKLVTIDIDRNDKILGFDLVFVGQNNTDFNAIFCYTGCFENVNFQEFNLCTYYINFELPSAFLYALCELLEEQAVLCGNNRSSRPEVFCKKGVLRNFAKFTGKHLYQIRFFNKVAGLACNFVKKESLAQVFFCEFCEISKNTVFYRTLQVASSKIIVFKKSRDSLTNFTFNFQIQILLFLRVE